MSSEDQKPDLSKAMPVPTPEFPSPEQLSGYGDLAFLYLRCAPYAQRTQRDLRRAIQSPVDLMQFRVFRIKGVPRFALTWAHLSPQAELKLASGEPLKPEEWRSGPQTWLMDVVAPYGQGTAKMAIDWFKQNMPPKIERVRYLRRSATGEPKKLGEARRIDGTRWTASAISIKA